MQRREGEPRPQKPLLKRVWDAVTRRGSRKSPPIDQPLPTFQRRQLSPELQQFEREEREKWLLREEEHRQAIEQPLLMEQLRAQRELEAQRKLANKKTRETDRGRVVCEWLEQEIQRLEIDRRAEVMQKYTWGNSQNIQIMLHPFSTPSATEQADETFIDSSKVGRELSYLYHDVGEYTYQIETSGQYYADEGGREEYSNISRERLTGVLEETRCETLAFGIGYFTDRTYIIDEAQRLLSDEELQTGVKAYFIQRNNRVAFLRDTHYKPTFMDEYTEVVNAEEVIDGKNLSRDITELYVFPIAHPESLGIFRRHLAEIAKNYHPDTVVQQAKERRRS